jgi:methylenetetrahydrofolate dehydrogenase (NADP+)/methenyltetrahydrofolate cyclohydrolase
MTLLAEYRIPLSGARAVVAGRSIDVGRPMAALLTNADATVTICHSKTKDLPEELKRADILVSAIGRAHFIQPGMVKPGAVVIDVGINQLNGKLVGDVDFETVKEIASAVTPVPGGVGPMTIATLMENTFRVARERVCGSAR